MNITPELRDIVCSLRRGLEPLPPHLSGRLNNLITFVEQQIAEADAPLPSGVIVRAEHFMTNPPKLLQYMVFDPAGQPLCTVTSEAMHSVRTPDTEMLDWVLPLVTGTDDAEADRRTNAMMGALVMGKNGREAIQLAMQASK